MFIHLGTITQTRFALADEKGNIIKEFQPFEAKIGDPSEEVFSKVSSAIEEYRQKLINEIYPPAQEAPSPNGQANYPTRMPPPNLKRR